MRCGDEWRCRAESAASARPAHRRAGARRAAGGCLRGGSYADGLCMADVASSSASTSSPASHDPLVLARRRLGAGRETSAGLLPAGEQAGVLATAQRSGSASRCCTRTCRAGSNKESDHGWDGFAWPGGWAAGGGPGCRRRERVIRQGRALYRVDNGSPVVLLYGRTGRHPRPDPHPVPRRDHPAGPGRRHRRNHHRRDRHRRLCPRPRRDRRHPTPSLGRRPGRCPAHRRPGRPAAHHPRRPHVPNPGTVDRLTGRVTGRTGNVSRRRHYSAGPPVPSQQHRPPGRSSASSRRHGAALRLPRALNGMSDPPRPITTRTRNRRSARRRHDADHPRHHARVGRETELAARRPADPITLRDGHGADFATVAEPILMAVHTRVASLSYLLAVFALPGMSFGVPVPCRCLDRYLARSVHGRCATGARRGIDLLASRGRARLMAGVRTPYWGACGRRVPDQADPGAGEATPAHAPAHPRPARLTALRREADSPAIVAGADLHAATWPPSLTIFRLPPCSVLGSRRALACAGTITVHARKGDFWHDIACQRAFRPAAARGAGSRRPR
jgi:hypothetical protein